MARDVSGNYTLPAGNPVATGTIITVAWGNGTCSDIGNELTNSLDRNGRGGMLAALRGVDGTVAAPAFSFTSEPTSGWYRASAGVIALSVTNRLTISVAATGAVTIPAPTAGSNLTINQGTLGAAGVAGLVVTSSAGNLAQIIIAGNAAALGSASFDIFQNSTGGVALVNRANAAIDLYTNGVDRFTVSANGNVAIAAPSSGQALTVTGVGGTDVMRLVSFNQGLNTTSTGASAPAFFTPSGQDAWRIGAGSVNVNDFGIYNVTRSQSVVEIAGGATGGNVTIQSPASGTALTIKGVASTSGLILSAPGTTQSLVTDSADSVSTAVGSAASGGYIGTSTNHSLTLNSAGVGRVLLSTTGAVTINAPSAGVALTVTGVSAGTVITAVGDAAADSTPISMTGRGFTSNLSMDASGSFFSFGGAQNFRIYTNSVQRIIVGSAGNVTINAPSSGVALAVTGVANANVITATASGTGAALVANSMIQDRYGAFKATDESRNTTTTLANDSALSLSSLPVGSYNFTAYLNLNAVAPGSQGIKLAFAFSGTLSVNSSWVLNGIINNTASSSTTGGAATLTAATISTATDSVVITGSFTVTAAGNFSLQWAQNSSSANATTVKAGSTLTAIRI